MRIDFIEIEYRERDAAWGMSDLQSHDYYELYFLLDGNREFFYGNKLYNITEDTLCVIPPFMMHKTSGGPYKRVNINISTALLSDREKDLLTGLSDDCVYRVPKELSTIIVSLLLEGANISLVEQQEKNKVILSFVHTVLYLLERGNLKSVEHEASTERADVDTLMLKVVSYLNKNYKEELQLDDISEHFYISKNTLCARFKESMRCSVMQYLGFVRLSRAKELLTTTNKSIEEIAELCGYSSANYFSLSFKAAVGISPKNYRKTK